MWSEDPLSSSTVALETWIEGKKYFDRAADLARRPALDREREELVAKAKKILERGGKPEGDKSAAVPPPAATRAPDEPERKATPPVAAPAPTPTPAPRRQP